MPIEGVSIAPTVPSDFALTHAVVDSATPKPCETNQPPASGSGMRASKVSRPVGLGKQKQGSVRKTRSKMTGHPVASSSSHQAASALSLSKIRARHASRKELDAPPPGPRAAHEREATQGTKRMSLTGPLAEVQASVGNAQASFIQGESAMVKLARSQSTASVQLQDRLDARSTPPSGSLPSWPSSILGGLGRRSHSGLGYGQPSRRVVSVGDLDLTRPVATPQPRQSTNRVASLPTKFQPVDKGVLPSSSQEPSALGAAVDAWLQDARTQAPIDVFRRIAKGKQFLRNLQPVGAVSEQVAAQTAELQERGAPCPEDLVDAVWALGARAAADGEPFFEGAFTLYNGMSGEVASEHDAVQSLMAHVRSTPTLYNRLSSHLSAFKDAEIWGMDVIEARDGAALPGGRHHLLIHLIEDPQLGSFVFLKAERYGTQDLMNFMLHGVSFLQSMSRRISGANDAEGMRKERVPKQLISKFAEIVALHEQASTMLNDVTTRGVSAAAHWLRIIMQEAEEGLLVEGCVDLNEVAALSRDLHAEYSNVARRIGRERIELLPLPASVRLSQERPSPKLADMPWVDDAHQR